MRPAPAAFDGEAARTGALAERDVNELPLIAGEVVDRAARLLIQGRSHIGGLVAKGDRDYASRVDFQIEDTVKGALSRACEGIPFLGEERGGQLRAPLLWVLDPVDGTTNFIKGSPLCAISLALLSEGKPIFGIVDLPLLNERYIAPAGAGAYMNGRRLHMPATRGLADTVVAITDFAVADDRDTENPMHIALLAQLAPRGDLAFLVDPAVTGVFAGGSTKSAKGCRDERTKGLRIG